VQSERSGRLTLRAFKPRVTETAPTGRPASRRAFRRARGFYEAAVSLPLPEKRQLPQPRGVCCHARRILGQNTGTARGVISG